MFYDDIFVFCTCLFISKRWCHMTIWVLVNYNQLGCGRCCVFASVFLHSHFPLKIVLYGCLEVRYSIFISIHWCNAILQIAFFTFLIVFSACIVFSMSFLFLFFLNKKKKNRRVSQLPAWGADRIMNARYFWHSFLQSEKSKKAGNIPPLSLLIDFLKVSYMGCSKLIVLEEDINFNQRAASLLVSITLELDVYVLFALNFVIGNKKPPFFSPVTAFWHRKF